MNIKHLMHEVVEFFIPERKSFWQKNKWYIIGGSGLVLAVGGYYGYHIYTTQRNAEAFGALGRYVEHYLKNTNDDKNVARLDDGALALEAQSWSGSDAAPYFSAYEAQELINKGNLVEAVQVLKKAVANMPSGSPVTALYTVKLALVQLDVEDQQVKTEGLALLQKLAQDKKSAAWDVAVYYLGRYAWVKGDVEEAKKIWQPAIDEVAKARAGGELNRYSESPWLNRAKLLLDTIS